MGKTGLYLKIAILAVGLVVVVVVIRGVTTDKVQDAFQAMGLEPGAEGQPGFQAGGQKLEEGEERRTLCQTRVHAIRFPDGTAVVEKKEGMKLDWTAEEAPVAQTPGTQRSVSYLEIEKWFSQHCQFIAIASPPAEKLEPSNEPVKFILVEFIDNSKWELYRSGDVLFSAANPTDRFESPDLVQAIEELRALAGFAVDSEDR